jgi:hypothetical protein
VVVSLKPDAVKLPSPKSLGMKYRFIRPIRIYGFEVAVSVQSRLFQLLKKRDTNLYHGIYHGTFEINKLRI